MTNESAAEKKVALMRLLLGSGLPVESPKGNEFQVVETVFGLHASWSKLSPREAHDLCAGNWRLIWSTSEKLKTLNSIRRVKLHYESIGDATVHAATVSSIWGILIIFPAAVFLTLFLTPFVGILKSLGFFGGILFVLLLWNAAREGAPAGLIVERRNALKIDDDLVVHTKLERDAAVVLAESVGFDSKHPDPMAEFCSVFDASNGAKDALRPGFLFGWRLTVKPLGVHFKSEDRLRREKILYVDRDMRIMMGGDVSSKTGVVSQTIQIFVKSGSE